MILPVRISREGVGEMWRKGVLNIELRRGENEYRIVITSTGYFIASTEMEKPRRAWVVAVEAPSSENPHRYVAELMDARQLDIRCDLIPGVVSRVRIWLYDDVVVVDVDDVYDHLPFWLSFELPWNRPPDILKLEANLWDGNAWRRDTILSDLREQIRLDMKEGVLSLDVRHNPNLWRITLVGEPQTPAS